MYEKDKCLYNSNAKCLSNYTIGAKAGEFLVLICMVTQIFMTKISKYCCGEWWLVGVVPQTTVDSAPLKIHNESVLAPDGL